MSVQAASSGSALSRAPALLKATYQGYTKHNVMQLAAAISYFALFSVAPLIIVIVEIGGFFLHSHTTVRNEVFGVIERSSSPSVAATIRQLVDAAFSAPRQGIVAQIVGWAVFLLGAIGFFGALQAALNTIWDVQPKQGAGWREAVRTRALSFALILGIAFMILALLVVDSAVNAFVSHQALGAATPFFLKLLNYVVVFIIEALLFAALFKVLPETAVSWHDVIFGAVVTAVLFSVGQAILAWYLGRAAISSAYGAFGSIIALLLWVNYSAQIVLAGALFTKAERDIRPN